MIAVWVLFGFVVVLILVTIFLLIFWSPGTSKYNEQFFTFDAVVTHESYGTVGVTTKMVYDKAQESELPTQAAVLAEVNAVFSDSTTYPVGTSLVIYTQAVGQKLALLNKVQSVSVATRTPGADAITAVYNQGNIIPVAITAV